MKCVVVSMYSRPLNSNSSFCGALLILFVLCSGRLSAQSALDFYNAGVTQFKKGNFRGADSLLTLSIDASPMGDAYYNRAVARGMMNDLCGYCKDMDDSYVYFEDKSALSHYRANCLMKADTTFLTGRFAPVNRSEKHRYYDVRFLPACDSVEQGRVFDVKERHHGLGLPSTSKPKYSNIIAFKTNVVAHYYYDGNEKVYTSFMGMRAQRFRGEDEELLTNQMRQLLINSQPKLRELYADKKLLLYVIVSPSGNITKIHCGRKVSLDASQFAKVKDVLRSMLLRNYEYTNSAVLDKAENVEYLFFL